MDADLLKQLENDLRDWKAKLLNQASISIGNDIGVAPELSRDPADLASTETDRNFTLRLRDRERKLIAKIDEALDRIQRGTYGICEHCGDHIGEKRLQARPVATLCIRCKTEQEREER